MTVASTTQPRALPKHRRSLRNFLLDPSFQLKYAALLALIALVVGGALGAVLWRSGQAVLAQSQATVRVGGQVVEHGRALLAESKKVSEVVKMNIVQDPVYRDNPALLEAFQTEAKVQDAAWDAQQRQLEAQEDQLRAHSTALERDQHRIALVLLGTLGLLVAGLWCAGIIITHKVAGPVHKLKREVSSIASGRFHVPLALRRGDELTGLFDAFRDMVLALRTTRERDLAVLDRVIASLPAQAAGELEQLERLRSEMRAALAP